MATSTAPTPSTSAAAAPITVFKKEQRTQQTTQTPGMLREEILSRPGIWVGVAHTAPGTTSGWHHHADHDSYLYLLAGKIRMEFGSGGHETCAAEAGDLLHVPAHCVHRESNPGADEQVILVTRVGHGDIVLNVDCPAE